MKRNLTFRQNTAAIGMLAAFGVILMYLEVPLPFMPPFMKLDLSDVPAVMGFFFLGFPSAIVIAAVKNILHLLVSSSLGIGEICNFLVAIAFLSAWHGGRRFSERGAACAAVLSMTALAALLNVWVLLPLYQAAFHITEAQLLALTRAAGTPAFTIVQYILFVVIPFNLIKGSLIAAVALLLKKRIAPYFDK